MCAVARSDFIFRQVCPTYIYVCVQSENISNCRLVYADLYRVHLSLANVQMFVVLVNIVSRGQLFDSRTYTYTYILADKTSREAVIIDPVIELVQRDVNVVRDLKLNLKYASKGALQIVLMVTFLRRNQTITFPVVRCSDKKNSPSGFKKNL